MGGFVVHTCTYVQDAGALCTRSRDLSETLCVRTSLLGSTRGTVAMVTGLHVAPIRESLNRAATKLRKTCFELQSSKSGC